MTSIYDDLPGVVASATDELASGSTGPRVKRSKKREALTATELRQGQKTLAEMVDDAFATLRMAMREADYTTAIKAAQIILDRSGFGPKSTVDVNSTHVDLSELSREELALRAIKVAEILRDRQKAIDITPVAVN